MKPREDEDSPLVKWIKENHHEWLEEGILPEIPEEAELQWDFEQKMREYLEELKKKISGPTSESLNLIFDI